METSLGMLRQLLAESTESNSAKRVLQKFSVAFVSNWNYLQFENGTKCAFITFEQLSPDIRRRLGPN